MATDDAVFNQTIPRQLHKRVKSAAALRGVTIRQFLIDALKAHLKATPAPPKETAA
jgi:predicted HicB family RNase H-like nuclease